ncbi:ubiquitin ligase protein BRE1 [Cordyceps militaris CM01]|uniref:E3 ubiquitin protein ligase n=1 Tax=Cordyceps militaris (strain CM01) TaxID=983644 RepID=G3J9D9_CORMM|nr:ubiquitin ligase protein BRE1 [Cordyceps militaris CM01]EGX94118.1 ubiquitin ligase protein BRE1 [Cordyceps militaris CM01]
MEDRKRPAVGSADDLAPPSKRVAVNGSKPKDDAPEMKEESWIEVYTKGAIYRQMQEYSRRAATAESRLEEVHKRAVHHDDHIRIIDAWWQQVLDEIELLADASIPTKKLDGPPFLSSVSFKDLQHFQSHLQEKGKAIKTKTENLLQRVAALRGEVKPEITALEGKITGLHAAQKEYLLKLDRLNSEKDTLSEQLNTATLRYFKAEKKLDRAKSSQVQKLEQQAFANATRPPSATKEGSEEPAPSNGAGAELLLKYEETAAAASKQKEQLDNLLGEIRTLRDENSTMKAKRESCSDEDFIRTDVFKQFKGQNEELIKRLNNLEATNKQLREEAEKLQSERTTFRTQLEAEASQVASELEADIAARDQDLARVRSTRDEILAENTQRKASMEQERLSLEHMKDLVSAKEDRISALESEIARLKPSADEKTTTDLSTLTEDELRQKFKKLEKDFQAINHELPSIEKAFKKMRDLGQQRVMDFAGLEEKIQLLMAEKNKADQKYFAARKDADTRNNEIRSLRHQNSKSAEIIAQLKDLETQNRTLLGNLEKQMGDLRLTNATLALDNKKMESATQDGTRRVESLTKQIADLSNLTKSRDSALAVIKERNILQEAEVEKLKVRIEHAQKDRDNWRSKALSNSSEEEEMLRTYALCTICRNNFKNTALKTCGHLFCSKCVEDRISNRMRKCPTCSRAFDKMDVMPVHH